MKSIYNEIVFSKKETLCNDLLEIISRPVIYSKQLIQTCIYPEGLYMEPDTFKEHEDVEETWAWVEDLFLI
jgi:hypothetical protein